MTAVATIAWYALQEALRRRVFLVVVLLTLVFLGLYWLGAREAYEESRSLGATTEVGDLGTVVDVDVLVGATMFGLAMFATLFLGTVLAVFLTLGAVRGDAERGLLQPLVVRPVGRAQFLLARFLGAAAVCMLYVLAVYGATMAITNAAGGWWPDELVRPGVQLAAGVVILVALSLLGSIFLSSTANGILVFMLFGAGLVGGLLGQIGEGLDSQTLRDVSDRVSWALPFEALYQDGLHRLTAESAGFTRFALSLGPFGGAQVAGDNLPLWAATYLALVGVAAVAGFARRDL
jgi:ABC-type transport system involved in multi-copper enzyme maturation permease subunit